MTFLVDRVRCVRIALLLQATLLASTQAPLAFGSAVEAVAPPAGGFREVECWFRGVAARCGFMHVPENHGEPRSRIIKFPVVIFSSEAAPEGEPIVVLGGGGPGNTVGVEADDVAYHWELFGEPFVSAGRDVILMEQRGVGRAAPSTTCLEVIAANDRMFREQPDWEREWRETRAALKSCRERLRADGVDLANYDTVQSAADAEALREALGYERWVLYGASYGAQIAFELMRRYPASVRAVILDSPATPDFYYYRNNGRLSDDAIDQFLARCETAAPCRTRYPRLRRELAGVLRALDERHASVVVTRPGTEEPYEFILDRARLVDVLFDALYDPGALSTVPAAIHAAHEGRFVLFSPHVASYLRYQLDRDFGDGLAIAVNCREEVANTAPESIADYRERFSGRRAREVFAETLHTCRELALGDAGSIVKQPVESETPTLILSGEADPVTPVHLAESAKRHLPNATLIRFSEEAHYVFYDACARQLAKLWLDGTAAGGLGPCFRSRSTITIVTADRQPVSD